MADGDRGNECDGDGGWFLVEEADCTDDDNDEEFEHMFDCSTDEASMAGFIDDTETDCASHDSHAALLNIQMLKEDRQGVADLKRKYATPSPKAPSVQDLSPQLEAVSLSPRKKSSKRRLFEDSGISSPHETSGADASPGQVPESQNGRGGGVSEVINASHKESAILLKFKDTYGVHFKDLCRVYKSDKTCCNDWVTLVFDSKEEIQEAAKSILQNHSDFFQMQCLETCIGWMCFMLINFKFVKNRETLRKLLAGMFCVPQQNIFAEPPKNRSVPVALYFYKSAMNRETYKHGEYPDWLGKQLQLSHQSGSETFELAKMVQWAYDRDLKDEATVAYQYAQQADTDPNAAAWLKSNGHAKFVKDCCAMVRLYKRYEMRQMSMSQWIAYRCQKEEEEGDWREIAKFLKYQGVALVHFLGLLRQLLAGTPKKNCLLIHGPPDTGKSTFAFSMISFLGGGVVSFVNSKSQFWLSPLIDAKIGLLDDATHACFTYMDQNMRSSLDGNAVSIDCKHKLPTQMKMPPMLMTSNIDLHDEPLYFYLKSRIKAICFPRTFPFNADGSPLFSLTAGSWRSFFQKLHQQLGLDEDDFKDGEPTCPLRCAPRSPVSTY